MSIAMTEPIARRDAARVAIFGAGERKVHIYHLRRHDAGTGMTLCGLLFDSTCKRRDAIRGGLRQCWNCRMAMGREDD